MSVMTVELEVPLKIARGLASGAYERVGGVIRDAKTKQVEAWLREVGTRGPDPSDVLTVLGTASSMLNLAVSTMGFAVVMQRLGTIQRQLQEAQKVLQGINYKVDLSFYGNLCAALDLATNAFTMRNPANRKASALQAINRFLEAERHYTHLVDLELEQGSRLADEYLVTLSLAYITEVRCYLQLDELDTAHRRLRDGWAELRPRYEQLVHVLLTSNPAAYLHPILKDRVELRRLTRVYQWLQPDLDEVAVFEEQRDNLFALARQPEVWLDSLPPAFLMPKKNRLSKLRDALPYLPKRFPGRLSKDESASEGSATPFDGLPEMLDLIEQLIEGERRFQMYETEIEATRKLGISFQDWLELAPASAGQTNGANLMCILPTEQMNLVARGLQWSPADIDTPS